MLNAASIQVDLRNLGCQPICLRPCQNWVHIQLLPSLGHDVTSWRQLVTPRNARAWLTFRLERFPKAGQFYASGAGGAERLLLWSLQFLGMVLRPLPAAKVGQPFLSFISKLSCLCPGRSLPGHRSCACYYLCCNSQHRSQSADLCLNFQSLGIYRCHLSCSTASRLFALL